MKRGNLAMKLSIWMTLLLTISVGLAVAAGDTAAGKAVYDLNPAHSGVPGGL